ncbi:Tetratricopeptide repeat protein 1 [Paragonimus heterotremus]|uniref:Tetratricopeptide repeat protein 1 n=1 Tax=Paragonimus heterotremus TaxID=100268 RepID=A0A8J4TAR9_9TREM|nr:Tetratricopeptide repeat protein 1 [Paragonimus heterotremus]
MDSDSEQFSDAREDLFDDPFNLSTESEVEECLKPSGSSKKEKASGEPASNDDPLGSQEPDHDELRKAEEAKLSTDELQKRMLESLEVKERGNSLFKDSQYSDALTEYSAALDRCPLIYQKERSFMLSNRAACHIKLGAPDAALSDCDEALKLQPNYVRCLQRRAQVKEDMDRLSEALEDYQNLLKLDPGNERARWACMTLPERVQKQQEEMKEKMLGQLKQLGNMVLKPFGLSTENFKVQKNPDSEGYSINFVR